MRHFVICLSFSFVTTLTPVISENAWAEVEETSEYWNEMAQDHLADMLRRYSGEFNKNVAKNIIIYIGDGMGIQSVTAGRILKGQLMNRSGEETVLDFESLPFSGLSKTYSVNTQTPDSACTATAYLCGVKTNDGLLGLSAQAQLGNCSSEKGTEVKSILYDAKEAGKSTGIVTTTRINHATPAASYAHSASRYWYSDADLTPEAKLNGCKDIALQFLEKSDNIDVALGGGRKYFTPEGFADVEYPSTEGERQDGRNLIEEWLNNAAENEVRKYVWNLTEFDKVDPVATDKLLGMFEPVDVNYIVDREDDGAGEPTLEMMTKKAIKMLQKNENGFFLLVEGGRIDHGHHAGSGYASLHEVVELDKAVKAGMDLTSETDTLIVVSSDHSHTMSFGGYTVRGNPIFDLAPSRDAPYLALDDKPYTAILYHNGPGYVLQNGSDSRPNLTDIETDSRDYLQQSAVPRDSETHGGEDVAIYARGPMAHLFHGVHEQSYITHVMRYASCLGGVTEHCEPPAETTTPVVVTEEDTSFNAYFLWCNLDAVDAVVALYVNFSLVITLAFFAIFMATMAVIKYKRNIIHPEMRNGKTEFTDKSYYRNMQTDL